MLNAHEDEVLRAFEAVHGKLSRHCRAEVVYHEDYDYAIAGVACMKDGQECWRATLAELTFDLMMAARRQPEGDES